MAAAGQAFGLALAAPGMITDLERYNKVRDLRVIVDNKLLFSDHITEKVI